MKDSCWIQSYTGMKVHPLNLRPEQIRIEDIAHALSLQCRFAGHVRQLYSVGEHSVRIAAQLQREGRKAQECLWGLLHDASEAYIQDITRPVKRSEIMKGYRELEERTMKTICAKFGLPAEQPDCVTEADQRILVTEKRDLLGPSPDLWTEEQGLPVEPYPWKIEPWGMRMAELSFMERFHKYASVR